VGINRLLLPLVKSTKARAFENGPFSFDAQARNFLGIIINTFLTQMAPPTTDINKAVLLTQLQCGGLAEAGLPPLTI
jgi:hypothetical protein